MNTRTLRLRRPLAASIAFIAVLAVFVAHPDRPVAQPGTAAISADSILATARALSGETGIGPRSRFAPLPSTALYAAWIKGRLAAAIAPLGGEVALYPFPSAFGDTVLDVRDPYTNVVGVIRGSHAEARPGFYLIGAHFDATAQRDADFEATWRTHVAPGADDNGSGVAVTLEAMRVLAARGARPDLNLVVAFFDGEEQQIPEPKRFLLGSTEIAGMNVDSLEAELGPLYGVVNTDMIAYNPRVDSLVVMTNIQSRWLADRMLRAHADAGLEGSLLITRVVQGLAFSDHAPFWDAGYDAVLFIEATTIVNHAPHYHKAIDTVDNTYLRGGSQARKTAEVLLAFLESLAPTAARDSLVVTGEDIIVRKGVAVDLPVVSVGESVEIQIGVTNLGATRTTAWSLGCDVIADRFGLEMLDAQEGPVPFPAGARATFRFAWKPELDAVGSPIVRAVLDAPGAAAGGDGERRVAVRGGDTKLVRAWVYPNPTRFAARAVLHYELSQRGSVRATLLDLTGRELAEADLPLDNAAPIPGTDYGASDLAMEEIFPASRDLAPGVYLVRVELFDGAASKDVTLVKWAVLR